MEQIAFIAGKTVVYWKPLLLMAGAVTAIFFFLWLYLQESGRGLSAACAVPLSMVLGLALSRLVHWYCRPGEYAGLQAAMRDFSGGDYALIGVFGGCLITAGLLRLLRISDSAPAMLDAMSIAGGAGIAVGRLAFFFSASDRGLLLENLSSLPLAYPVTNPVSGAQEYRLATFLLQAMAAGVIFLLLACACPPLIKRKRLRPGDGCLFFLLLYCASQVVLDSTRYDSLPFRSNGFVSVVQVFSALAIGFVLAVFSVRLVRLRGFRPWYLALWLLIAALLGTAGYMEYYVQRHGSMAAFSYSIMSAALGGIVLLVAGMAFLIHGPRACTGKFVRNPGRSGEEVTK